MEIISLRKQVFTLICLVAAGGLLRFYHIGYQSLWLDELYSVIPTNPQNSAASIIEYCKSDQPPVFFLYIHYVFKLFNYNEVTGRIACMVIGLLSIPVVYFLGKEVGNNETGLFAAFLATINYYHIYYSQELRFYTMAFFFSSLSYLFFIRAYKNLRVVDFILYTITTASLLYTHYFGMFVFGTQGVTFLCLLFYKRQKQFVIAGVLSGILICVLFIPWLPTVFRDLTIPAAAFWITPPKVFFLAEYFYGYTGKDAFTLVVLIGLTSLFIMRIANGKTAMVHSNRDLYLILILWIVLCYLVPYLKSLISTPVLLSRYTLVILPAWFVVFALGWNHIKNVKLKYTISVLMILASLVNLVFFRQHYTKITKTQFRESSELVKKKNKDHYPIYSILPWHFNFYFRDYPEQVISLYESDLSQIDKFWLLQAHFFSEEGQKAILDELGSEFTIIEEYVFYDAKAILMKRNNAL